MNETDDLVRTGVVPPRPTASMVARNWLKAFGPKGKDISQNLLHIGVGSRRIARFVKMIESDTGIKIPLTTAMQLGSIDAIADAIDTGTLPAISPLIMLKEGSPGSALYVVAAGGGFVLELCDVVAKIDFPGRIYGLQLPGLDGEAEPLASIEAIAEFNVNVLLSAHPDDLCHIMGYSFGGLVAYEMARVLTKRDKRIGLLGLIDTCSFETYWPASEWIFFLMKQTSRRALELMKMNRQEGFSYLCSRFKGLLRLFNRRLNTGGQKSFHDSIYYVPGLDADHQNVRNASITAFESYRPTALPCDVVLFKSALGDPHACNPVKIWRRLVSKLDVVVVNGTHTTMVRHPNAEKLAAAISKELERCGRFETIWPAWQQDDHP